MSDFIAHLGPVAVYPSIFIGIIFLGGLVLVPAMYLSLSGTIHLMYLFIVTVAAGATADMVWYTIGRLAKKERIFMFSYVRKRLEEAKKFSSFFNRHGVLLVYLTKFIWGTRVASHLLAGLHRIPVAKFLGSTALGTATWFGIFYVLVRSVDFGVAAVQVTARRVEVIFLLMAVLLLFFNWCIGTFLRKKIMKRDAAKSR